MSKNDELSWNYGKMIIFGDIDFDGYPKILRIGRANGAGNYFVKRPLDYQTFFGDHDQSIQ